MSILDDIIRAAMRGRYPEVMPPVLKFDKKKGKEYLAKELGPEAKQVKLSLIHISEPTRPY